MRIKCPNSDVFLELPGDRTDMKFTCPACHKVHRVTVSITTPGEDAPPPAQPGRSVTRTHPAVPKRYATGAYPPVVDIPIDANFVLVESGREPQPGVDLGEAAPKSRPAVVDDDLSSRRTEIYRQNEERPATPPPENAGDEAAAGKEEIPATEADTVVADEAPAAQPQQDWTGPAVPRRSRPRVLLWLLILVLLGAAGYLGWRHLARTARTRAAAEAVREAETAWREGAAAAAGRHVAAAQSALGEQDANDPAAHLWNRFAQWTGLPELPGPEAGDLEKQVATNRERVRTMEAFARNLDPSDAGQMAALLREAGQRGPHYEVLAESLQAEVVDSATGYLESLDGTALPEELAAVAARDLETLAPALSPTRRRDFENRLGAFVDSRREAFAREIRDEAAGIAQAANAGDAAALDRFLKLDHRLKNARGMDVPDAVPALAEEPDRAGLEQLARLAADVAEARAFARSVLSRSQEEDFDAFAKRAEEDQEPHPKMAEAAVRRIDEARAEADDLLRLRAEVFGRAQSELRRGRSHPGTMLAWSMLRVAFDDTGVQIDPASFRFDSGRARMDFAMDGVPASMEMDGEDYENRIRATMHGYRFTAGWALLFHKPLVWTAALARSMHDAGVDSARHPDWELLEGPEGPLALSLTSPSSATALGAVPAGAAPRRIFFNGRLLPVEELPAPADSRQVVDEFHQAARALHDRVMAEESIPAGLRQALKPVLMGTYGKPDPRDFFDSAFCRRLIEADYLESFLNPMPDAVRRDLETYRRALGRLEAGYDDFRATLDDGRVLYAVLRPDADAAGGRTSDQDLDTGESVQRYTWRMEYPDATVFHSPLPSRFVYAFMLAEHYAGVHRTRPAGVPRLTEVWHATRGRVASYHSGAARATGDSELWNRAIAEDTSGRFDPSTGTPGWNFPLHVLERDDQGDPVTLATLSGTVRSPDFTGIADAVQRRRAEDEWLDATAATLSTPGELGLIFHQFFRYCSDSPMPELPNLIGSHFGLSDTHQTVYQSLERRWVGRLIGDCDDLAEFFQVLTRRQGKLSHVMQLPGHAACGYVDATPDGFRFVVLQTGPVLQFNAPTLTQAVEAAYRSFDRSEGISHMTMDAVPLLLRFADEETRTPFVLSARIYGDPEYAETMTRVQGYWHEHAYSSAIEVMERMVREDQEIGNIKELGSLYERVGFYEKSAEMRRRELELVKDKPLAALSTLLDIAQLHFQEKNKPAALEALGEMESRMQAMVDADNSEDFFGAITFRSYWAILMSRLGRPERAWELVKYDALVTKRQHGRVAEPVLRTMAVMYERMCMLRDAGSQVAASGRKAMAEVRKELDDAFGRGYFKSDDSYNNIITRYYILGRFAVSDVGREEGLARLKRDGPYPEAAKDQTRRTRPLTDEDWKWFRITPQLYLGLGLEMLDRDDYPEFYDPAAAKPMLEDVTRAVDKGTGLGADVSGGEDVIKADMTLSFLNRDLEAFRRCLTVVKEKNYSSLYDDAALVLGLQGGLIPLPDFPEWIEAFREFFPGRQHYFKVVYRAIDKENYDHALMMAEATARFFPDDQLLRKEADFVRSIIPGLKERKRNREILERHGVGAAQTASPPAA